MGNNKPQHTPGPWITDMNEANARLIATGPELLAIVEYLKAHLDEGAHQVSFHALPTDDDNTTLGDLVIRAVAKARGGVK